MRLPDFIIGGAPRSGTTWLYELLDRHPQVYMAKPKQPEPKFFLLDELYERGLQTYSQTWFASASDDVRAGEKSTNYLESAAAAERIARDLPDVKLVFILREPAARAYSNYLWSRMNGHETLDFEAALAREDERERGQPEALRFARPFAYFSRGLYADLLTPYMDRFARDRILCLRFEDLVDGPRALAARLHGFIGVTPRPEDAATLGVVNPSEGGEAMPADLKRVLQQRYSESNDRLKGMLGSDFQTWNPDGR